jgi:hypothetical protein
LTLSDLFKLKREVINPKAASPPLEISHPPEEDTRVFIRACRKQLLIVVFSLGANLWLTHFRLNGNPFFRRRQTELLLGFF